jgi:uncharacterized protein (TIGR03067 family)
MSFTRFAAIALTLALTHFITTASAADPKLQELQGSWQLESLEVGGQKVPERSIADRVMMIGGRNAYMRHGTGIAHVLSINIHEVGDKKYINQAILQGQDAGAIQLGIYELKDDVLTICHDARGIDRPTEFKTATNTKQVLAVYKRKPAVGGDREITGHYTAKTIDPSGKTITGKAIIEKQGDAYFVLYQQGEGVAFIGIGLREGDTFSVSWRNNLQSGLSVYKIGEGRKLTGHYTVLGGNGAIHEESLQLEEA